jgi:hypothetical protein
MPSTFPGDSDIESLLTGSGLTVPSGYSFSGLGAWAQGEFQQRTGRVPFLEDSVDVARVFDPPGGRSKLEPSFYLGGEKLLELKAGLLSCNAVAVGVTPDNPDGQAMDLARQLRLLPSNAAVEGKPYSQIEFYFPVYGAPNSIVVTGKWGYSSAVPDDVWAACLRLGAAKAAADILEGITASPSRIKAGEDLIQQDSFHELGEAWRAEADRVIARYALARL